MGDDEFILSNSEFISDDENTLSKMTPTHETNKQINQQIAS
jgi:hypothetical protein